MNYKNFLIFFVLILVVSRCASTQNKNVCDLAPGLRYVDQYTIAGSKHHLLDYAPRNADGTVNAFIEIPAGTNEKWEVKKPGGNLKFDFKDGNPRFIKYLSYPANYGMVPGTLLSEEQGGDGDPLDVIVIGNSVPRGTVLKVKIIGVLKLIDSGETDDKLIAIKADYAINDINSLSDLQQKYPGVTEIIETWFSNYKGVGKMVSNGYRDSDVAELILKKSIIAFNETQKNITNSKARVYSESQIVSQN